MVKIAVISDIHFGAFARNREFFVPGEPAQDSTDGAASIIDGFIKHIKDQSVKYIFIPGDLTSTGKPQEFYYCAKRIVQIAKEAEIPLENIFWGTGNHDLDWGITKLYEDYAQTPSEVKEIVYEKYRLIAANAALINMNMIPANFVSTGTAPQSGIIDCEDFLVFVLNSSLYCSHDQIVKHGKLDNDQLEWFRTTTEKFKDDPRWKIVLMHHHPYNYEFPVPTLDVSGLEEGSELQTIAAKGGIHLVIHGHRHHPRAETVLKTEWRSPITFLCAGSFSVNAAHRSSGEIPNTFHIIELCDTPGLLTLKNYEYTLAEGWVPFQSNRSTAPLDSEMCLGKIFPDIEIDNAIRAIVNTNKEQYQIKWQDAPEQFRYSSLKRINSKIKSILTENYTVYGCFPNDICLVKRKEEE